VIPLTETTISISVAAPPVSSLFDHAAAVQGGSGSFASTCASLLSSTATDGTPIPGGADSNQSPKPSKEILPAGGTKAKTKDVQKDNPVATANSVVPINVPLLVAQVTHTSLPQGVLPVLPGSSGLNSSPAVAGLAPGITTANIPFQGPDSLRVPLDAPATTKQDAVGNVAPHLMKEEGEKKPPKMHDLFIDIGVANREEAQKMARIGDPITLVEEFQLLRGDLAISRAFDNRIGTFAVAETLRLLHEGKKQIHAEVCAVSNVMEEVGLLGARQIAYTLDPDIALVVDVTHATDYPTISQSQHGDVKIGYGPTLTHGGCNHPEVVARLERVAADQEISLQHEAMSANTGTDTDVIFWTRGGIASALISLPDRYMHSPVELVSLADLEKIPRLMSAFAVSLQHGEQFKVKI